MHRTPHLVACVVSLAGLAMHAATPAPSDLVAPQKRRAAVTIGEQLSRSPVVSNLPADLVDPFNPAHFDRAQAEGSVAAAPAVGRTAGPAGDLPASDREMLEILASLVPTAGLMHRDGKAVITLGPRRVGIGQGFPVVYKNVEYELVMVDITDRTFTLRYRNEEKTRSIQRALK